jgi:hypothetical protein
MLQVAPVALADARLDVGRCRVVAPRLANASAADGLGVDVPEALEVAIGEVGRAKGVHALVGEAHSRTRASVRFLSHALAFLGT